jgi:hypothetical protein
MRWVFSGLLVIFGFVVIWKTDWFLKSFGRVDWAERKLGSGGTWTFYKLLGIASIFLAFLLATGAITGILDFLFSR